MKATTTGSFQSHPYIPTKVIIEIELDRQRKCLPCRCATLPVPPSSSQIPFFENIGRQRQTGFRSKGEVVSMHGPRHRSHILSICSAIYQIIYGLSLRTSRGRQMLSVIKKATTKSSSIEPVRPASAPCNAAKLFFYPFSFSFDDCNTYIKVYFIFFSC